MDKVARLSISERRELFQETAARRRLPAALVEKDFWVCWTLLQLFTIPSFAGHIVFKGGTSLSKVFGQYIEGQFLSEFGTRCTSILGEGKRGGCPAGKVAELWQRNLEKRWKTA